MTSCTFQERPKKGKKKFLVMVLRNVLFVYMLVLYGFSKKLLRKKFNLMTRKMSCGVKNLVNYILK